MAAIWKYSARRLILRSGLLLARSICVFPLLESSQQLWTRRHRGHLSHSPRALGCASLAQEVEDEAADTSGTSRDIGEENGIKRRVRKQSQSDLDEEERRKHEGLLFINRFKHENGGKSPAAVRLALEVGGSKSWWYKFLREERESSTSPPFLQQEDGTESGTNKRAEVTATEGAESSESSQSEISRAEQNAPNSREGQPSCEESSARNMEKTAKQVQNSEQGSSSRNGSLRSERESSRKFPFCSAKPVPRFRSEVDQRGSKGFVRGVYETQPSHSPLEMEAMTALNFPGGRREQVRQVEEQKSGASESESASETESASEVERSPDSDSKIGSDTESEAEVDEMLSRGLYFKKIPQNATTTDFLDGVKHLGHVAVHRMARASLNPYKFAFVYYKTPEEANRAFQIARRQGVLVGQSNLSIERVRKVTRFPDPFLSSSTSSSSSPSSSSSSSFSSSSSCTKAIPKTVSGGDPLPHSRREVCKHAVCLHDIPEGVSTTEIERELSRCGKIADVTPSQFSNKVVVSFETPEARDEAVNMSIVWLADGTTPLKIHPHIASLPLTVRISNMAPPIPHSEMKTLCCSFGPHAKLVRRSRMVYDVHYDVPVLDVKALANRIRRSRYGPQMVVSVVKLYDEESWAEKSSTEGGAQVLRKAILNHISKIESVVGLLNVELHDLRNIMKHVRIDFDGRQESMEHEFDAQRFKDANKDDDDAL